MTDEVVCASGAELLGEYLEGVLPADTRERIESHVSGCARCQAFVASYRETPRIFRQATLVTLPEDLASSLLAALRERRGR